MDMDNCYAGGYSTNNSEILFFIILFLLLFYDTGYGY
jgi:hypothetical protein